MATLKIRNIYFFHVTDFYKNYGHQIFYFFFVKVTLNHNLLLIFFYTCGYKKTTCSL